MGKHSSSGNWRRDRRDSGRSRRRASASPRRIERLDPNTESRETPEEHERRRQRPDYKETRRKRERMRRIALGCLVSIVAVAVLTAIGGFAYLKGIDARLRAGMRDVDPDAASLLADEEVERGEPFNMIIMGTDNREGETAARSDTLIVAHIDPQQQRATLLSIPRDSRVEVPGHGTTKINAAAFYGGPSLVIETISEFTGLSISHYVEMDFNGFKEIVDALGGVTVEVPETIIDPKAGNYDPDVYKIYAGEQVLNGGQALTFVRSRNFPEGDIARIRNQQVFIKALLREALQFSSVFKINSLVEATLTNVTTDMSLGELLSLANDMKGMSDSALETVTMPGTPQYIGGVSYVVPDEDALAEMMERIQNGQTAVATAEEESAEIDPADYTVDVRNGAGLDGVAGDAASKVEDAGFVLGEVGNANQFVYDRTLIVYRDEPQVADLVRESLGMGDVIPSRGMYVFDTDILVVVGKDWGPVETE